jgi:hypothetical protein
MSATNGSAVSFRKRSRLIGCSVAIVVALSAIFASGAGATPVPIKESVLAVGDSLAFGYSQQLFNENYPTESPAAYEHGYANYYLNHFKPKLNGVQLVNNGCPGETTDSMIGNGALASAFGIPGESPCGYHKAGFPLHHEYGGVSQLENTLGTIAGLAGAGKPVTTVTLNIGANDELRQIAKCKAEVKAEYEAEGKSSKYGGKSPEEAVLNCLAANFEALVKHILTNIGNALYAIRNGEAFGGVNYGGKIVVQGGYDPYGNVYGTGEVLKSSLFLTRQVNIKEAEVVAKFGACYADPQARFNPENKYEPERLQKWTNMNNQKEDLGKKFGEPGADGPDIHPTLEGYKVLSNIMVKNCG